MIILPSDTDKRLEQFRTYNIPLFVNGEVFNLNYLLNTYLSIFIINIYQIQCSCGSHHVLKPGILLHSISSILTLRSLFENDNYFVFLIEITFMKILKGLESDNTPSGDASFVKR